MKKLCLVLFFLSVLSGCSARKHECSCPKDIAPKMSEKEMMDKMKEAATPGVEHEKLQSLVGSWKTVSKFWSAPDAKPEIQKGTSTSSWILGKRFVREEFSGKWNGQPFQGIGIIGYDKGKKEYTSSWLDTMSTNVMTSQGQFDASGKNLEMKTKFYCPFANAEKEAFTVTKMNSKNEHVFEMFEKSPDGKEVKMMEITYTRKGK